MAVTLGNQRLIFGIQSPKPLIGIPEGTAAIHMANDGFARVCICVGQVMADYYLETTEDGENWQPSTQCDYKHVYTHTTITQSMADTTRYHYNLSHGGKLRAKFQH